MESGDASTGNEKQVTVSGDPVEELMEAVTLGGASPSRPAVAAEATMASTAAVAAAAKSKDDDDVNALLNELDEESQRVETSAETQQALQKLKDSTQRLGTALTSVTRDLDTKLGFTSSLHNLDEQMNATQTLQESSQALFGQSFSTTLSGFWTSVDSVVTKPLQQTLETTRETELPIAPGETKTIGDALADGTNQINETFVKLGRSLKQVDESHKITAATATTLAFGADFLTASVFGATTTTPDNLDDLLTEEQGGEAAAATTTAQDKTETPATTSPTTTSSSSSSTPSAPVVSSSASSTEADEKK